MNFRHIFSSFFLLFLYLFLPAKAIANPYFYIQGDSNIIHEDTEETYYVRVNTDGSDLNAVQIAVTFDPDFYTSFRATDTDSLCNFWAPANSIPPGDSAFPKKITPYIVDNKAIFSCGFTDSINSSDAIIGALVLTAKNVGSSDITLSDSVLTYLGTNIIPGAMDTYTIITLEKSDATPTPTATATMNITFATPIVNTTTLFEDVTITDVSDNFSGNSSRAGTTGSTTGSSELEVLEEDNTVPPPPEGITPRPKATPFKLSDASISGEINLGEPYDSEVLAGQSLRDLLLPGKTKADKTVVLINLISTVVFILLLIFLLFRLFKTKKQANVKTKYINELISGELAALGTKMEITGNHEGKEKFKGEFEEAVDTILNGINQKDENQESKENTEKK